MYTLVLPLAFHLLDFLLLSEWFFEGVRFSDEPSSIQLTLFATYEVVLKAKMVE